MWLLSMTVAEFQLQFMKLTKNFKLSEGGREVVIYLEQPNIALGIFTAFTSS